MRSILVALMIFFVSSPVFAHKVNLFVAFNGDVIKGYAYYSSGRPACRAKIEVIENGTPLKKLILTDKSGRFELRPRENGIYEFILKTSDGHSARAEIKVGSTKKRSSSNEKVMQLINEKRKESHNVDNGRSQDQLKCISKKEMEAVLNKRLEPVEKRLEEISISLSSVTFHDVISGLGYIAGIMGLWAYFKRKGS